MSVMKHVLSEVLYQKERIEYLTEKLDGERQKLCHDAEHVEEDPTEEIKVA